VYPKLTDDWTLASTLSNQLPASIQALSYQNTWSPSVSPISSNSYDELEEDFSYIATQPGSNSLTRPSLSPILSGFGSEEALHYNYPFGYIDQKQSTNGSFSYSSSMLDHQPIIGNTITSSKPESITELNSVKGDTPIGYGPLAFPSQSISQYTFGQHGETTSNSDHQKIPPTSQHLQLQEADYLQPNTTTFWNIPYGQHQPYYYGATASEYH
jgi:hypothetical protein